MERRLVQAQRIGLQTHTETQIITVSSLYDQPSPPTPPPLPLSLPSPSLLPRQTNKHVKQRCLFVFLKLRKKKYEKLEKINVTCYFFFILLLFFQYFLSLQFFSYIIFFFTFISVPSFLLYLSSLILPLIVFFSSVFFHLFLNTFYLHSPFFSPSLYILSSLVFPPQNLPPQPLSSLPRAIQRQDLYFPLIIANFGYQRQLISCKT